MGVPYAEVIGDPIAHSKSPAIHKFWLERLGIEGDYRGTRVHHNDLGDYLADRRADPDWRGCSVSQPHKLRIVDRLDGFEPSAVAVGAINCVHRDGGRLIGANSDVDGVNAVFDARPWRANRATIIGAGGAARAVLEALRQRDVLESFMIVRDPESARPLHAAFARSGSVSTFDNPGIAFSGSEYVINASPLGMAGAGAMPESVFDGLERVARDATVFDMVYSPVDTEFLERARGLRLATATGLEMLIGQARAAFTRFFGVAPPPGDDGVLMESLTR